MKITTHPCLHFMLLLSISMHLSCLGEEAGEEEPVSPSEIKYLLAKGAEEESRREYKQALSTYKEALSIADKAVAPKQWNNIASRVANALGSVGQLPEAEKLFKEVLLFGEKIYGKSAPEISENLAGLGRVLKEAGRLKEAETLLLRALEIDEATLGKEDPKIAIRLTNLAIVFLETDRFKESEALMRRALAMNETTYGRDSPEVAGCLEFTANLLVRMDRLKEAEEILRRNVEIYVKLMPGTEAQREKMKEAIGYYASILIKMGNSEEQVKEKVRKMVEPPLQKTNRTPQLQKPSSHP